MNGRMGQSMITLHKLKIFILVCEQGSLNKAAGALYLSQSAVSQHIQDLEASLGTQLLERSPRGTHPTAAGEVLLDYARQMIQLLAHAERDIVQIDTAQSLQLDIGATPGISVYLIPRWLRDFQTDYDNINVSMQTGLTKDIIAGVMDTRYDLGFVEGEIDDLTRDGLGQLPFYNMAYDVVVGASHPWADQTMISGEQLSGHPFITRQPTSRTRRWLEAVLASHDIRLKNTTELDSPGTIKYALLEGGGISILPRYAVEREVERGELKVLSIEGIVLDRSLRLVWNQRLPLTTTQRAFLNMLVPSAPQLSMLL